MASEFTLQLDADTRLEVASLIYDDAISQNYTARVVFAHEPDTPARLGVGQRASVAISTVGGLDRVIHGVIRSFERRTGLNNEQHLVLVPQFERLSLAVDSRIFQQQTVVEVASQLLNEFSIRFQARLKHRHLKRPYCVQYEETTLAFIRRLLAEEGLFYYFEHSADQQQECLIIADDALWYGHIAQPDELVFAPHNLRTGENERGVRVFGDQHNDAPTHTLLTGYDFRHPAHRLHARAAATGHEANVPQSLLQAAFGALGAGLGQLDVSALEGGLQQAAEGAVDSLQEAGQAALGAAAGEALGQLAGGGLAALGTFAQRVLALVPLRRVPARAEVYEHHSEYEQPDVRARTAEVELTQSRRDADVCLGETVSRRMVCGHRFTLLDHPIEGLNGAYVVVQSTSRGDATGDAVGDARFSCSFRCVKANQAYLPERPVRQVRQVVESAMVVGPPGEEIHVDTHGRVKVQFHWDRDGHYNAHSSCWLRVMQPWAGAGWGSQFIPRVGMEVLVAFIGGDLDRPVILGALNNALCPPVYALPQRRTQSGIRTRSTPGGDGFNELMFDDKHGAELISVHAQRNLLENVGLDHRTEVKHDRSIQIGGDASCTVAGNHSRSTAGNHTFSVGRKLDISVAGQRSAAIEGDDHLSVAGSQIVDIGCSAVTTIREDAVLAVGGGITVNSAGSFSLSVGSAESPAMASSHVSGILSLGASEKLSFSADQELSLSCGDSVITITPDAIRLTANNIFINGTEKAIFKSDGPFLRLTDSAELGAEKVGIYSNGARVELDESAHVNGAKVLLNCSDGSVDAPGGESGDGEAVSLSLELLDSSGQPFSERHYDLTAGGRRIRGTTGADGSVQHDLPAGTTQAQLVLWPGDYPTGERIHYAVEIAELAPATTPQGAQQRLGNLGFDTIEQGSDSPAPTTGEPSNLATDAITALDPALRSALMAFQQARELPVTGMLDDDTLVALAEQIPVPEGTDGANQ